MCYNLWNGSSVEKELNLVAQYFHLCCNKQVLLHPQPGKPSRNEKSLMLSQKWVVANGFNGRQIQEGKNFLPSNFPCFRLHQDLASNACPWPSGFSVIWELAKMPAVHFNKLVRWIPRAAKSEKHCFFFPPLSSKHMYQKFCNWGQMVSERSHSQVAHCSWNKRNRICVDGPFIAHEK